MSARRTKPTDTVYDKVLPNKPKAEVNLSSFAFLFSEMVQYSHGRVSSQTQLHEKLSDFGYHVGFRMIDVLCLREKQPKRETRLVNMLWYIQKSLWRTLFGKEADRLEQATAQESTYEPLVNKFVSVPKDQSNLTCAAFIAGIIEGYLNGSQFPCKVRAFAIKEQTTHAFEIKFEDSAVSRDKMLEAQK
ncbi:hypothetical protein EMCRGX_G019216 [Ephydatia muelleri]|eukprot:Em0011g790a